MTHLITFYFIIQPIIPIFFQLSVGVIVIIVLVVLVILISVGYCIFKRRSAKPKQPEEPQKPNYAPVPTGESAPNPA